MSSYRDLYQIYKLIRQRALRDTLNDEKHEMAEMARRIVNSIYSAGQDKKTDEEFNQRINDELKELYQIEKMIRPAVYFSSRMKKLFNEKSYTIQIPYSVLPLWQNHTTTKGIIYIFTSNVWQGHSKLGATTIDVNRRLRLFSRRYDIEVDIAYTCSSYDPFNVERKVARVFSEFRVSSNVLGFSNEWYKIEPEIIARQIEEYRLETPPS